MHVRPNDIQQRVSGPTNSMQETGDYETDQIAALIKEASNIAVVPSKVAEADSFCACAGLYLMLKEKFESTTPSKDIKFLYAGQIPEACQGLIDENELTTNMTERELMLSIDYSGTSATKIQYNNDKENETFYFKLGPIPKNFDTNRIKAKITGFDFDLIFVVGAQELVDLGPIYNNLRAEINKADKINLDITNKNSRFGVINIIDTTADNLSTLIFKNAGKWDLIPSQKAAKALLAGMTYREAKHG